MCPSSFPSVCGIWQLQENMKEKRKQNRGYNSPSRRQPCGGSGLSLSLVFLS